MKRQLRISSYNDYVAIDFIDKNNNVLSTPFYLKYNSIGKLIHQNRGVCSVFISSNGHQKLYARDAFMKDFDIPFSDLLIENTIKFIEK